MRIRINKKLNVFLMMIMLAFALVSCGKNTSDNQTEVKEEVAKKEETATKEEAKAIDDKVADTEKKVEEADEEETASGDPVIDDFGLNILGCYNCYTDEGDYIFDINEIDGIYYLEYDSDFDYGAAELVLLNGQMTNDNQLEFSVMMYPFSGFSFAGEYWGAGNECVFSVINSDMIVLKEGHPLMYGQEISLERRKAEEYEETINPKTKELAKDMLGQWRASTKLEDETVNTFLELNEDGSMRAVSKMDDYPIAIYKGYYELKKAGGKITGSINCQRIGYGGMPYTWTLSFDEDNKCPVIKDVDTDADPLTGEASEDIVFTRAKAGEVKYILGPNSRGEQVSKMFNEFIGLSGDTNSDSSNEVQEELVNTLLEKAKAYTNAPICSIEDIEYDENGGGVITIHCFEVVDDGDGQGHTATYDWLYYDIKTGKFTDFMGDELEL